MLLPVTSHRARGALRSQDGGDRAWTFPGHHRGPGVACSLRTLELLAGAVNLTLMPLNARDAMRLVGKLRPRW